MTHQSGAVKGTPPLYVQQCWGGLGREPWMLGTLETGHALLHTKIGIEPDGSGAHL